MVLFNGQVEWVRFARLIHLMNQSLYRKRRLQINTSNKKIDLLEQQKSLEQELQEIESKEPREAEKPDFS